MIQLLCTGKFKKIWGFFCMKHLWWVPGVLVLNAEPVTFEESMCLYVYVKFIWTGCLMHGSEKKQKRKEAWFWSNLYWHKIDIYRIRHSILWSNASSNHIISRPSSYTASLCVLIITAQFWIINCRQSVINCIKDLALSRQ